MLEWANSYLDYSRNKFVKKTFEEKIYAFRLFFAFVDPSLSVDSLQSIHILQHLQIQAKNRSGHASNKDRKNLSAAWEWGILHLQMPDNPFRKVQKQSSVTLGRRVPSLAEFWQVYSFASPGQDRCMLLCYLYSGARRAELFQLRWSDVDFSSGRIRLFWKKNRIGTQKSAWLQIPDDGMKLLLDQQLLTGSFDWVFVEPGTNSPYQYRLQWMRRLCKRAGVERFGFHGIRHLCASILAGKGVPLVDIQYHLRHDHLSTTERYIHQLTQSDSVVNAFSNLKGPFQAP